MILEQPKSKKSPIGIVVWAALHIALLVAVVVSYPWKVDQDLYSIVPHPEETPEIQNAESLFSSKNASQILLFVGDVDFAVASEAAGQIEELLRENSQVKSVSGSVSPNVMEEVSEFAFQNRFYLQSPDLLKLNDSAMAEALYRNLLSRLYGNFSAGSFGRIEEDPFLLSASASERLFGMLSASGNWSVRDGALTVSDSGMTYRFIRAELALGTSMASDNHVLAELDKEIRRLQKEHPNLRVEKSGVPFHSYASSRQAKAEIGWISGISIVVIVLLLLCVFRSALPIGAILGSILVAILASTGATLAAFREIHIFTFVFGTSVIGVSIDYAIHHFADREAQMRSMLLGFMTTELSYIALGIVDFPLLRQMSFFSMVGLASALLSVLLVFPKLSERMPEKHPLPLGFPRIFLAAYDRMERIPRWARYTVYVLFAAALIPGFWKLQVRTDIRSMYKPSEELFRSEEKIRAWMNSGISPSYFIVSGNSEEEVLVREERLVEKLRVAEKDSLLTSHLAVSNVFPSRKRRNETKARLLRAMQVHREDVCKLLDIKCQTELLDTTVRNVSVPQSLKALFENLWIGKSGESYFSAVLPLHVTERFDIHAFADPENGIYAVNKMEEVNEALTELSRKALALVAFAYFAVFFILSLVYTWRDSLRIVRAPILACLLALSVFGYAQIPVNFFAIAGLILTLGIGIDYALFFKDSRTHADSTALSVILSAVTTLVSFGTLSLSGFAPVSVFGLMVLLGISACFLFSPFARD